MNTYLIIEGDITEKIIYEAWIKHLDPDVEFVSRPEDVVNNNILIVRGHGYPCYLELLKGAELDIIQFNVFDQLIVAVDSEDFSYDEKYKEIEEYLIQLKINIPYKILIQHFCIETWALGNQKIHKRNPQNKKLKSYQRVFNVYKNDPELMPEYKEEDLNRAQFASKYLNLMLQEVYPYSGYKKKSPKALIRPYYFKEITKRFNNKYHIKSFGKFLEYFSP